MIAQLNLEAEITGKDKLDQTKVLAETSAFATDPSLHR